MGKGRGGEERRGEGKEGRRREGAPIKTKAPTKILNTPLLAPHKLKNKWRMERHMRLNSRDCSVCSCITTKILVFLLHSAMLCYTLFCIPS